MKNSIISTAIILLSAVMACNKIDSVSNGSDGLISFAPAAENTRALIYNENLSSETFRVYDFLDEAKYIDNQIKYGTTGWEYVDNQDYLWKNGTHKLFGYTESLGALPSDNKVSYTKVLTTSAADQKDLLYSEIVNTTASAWKQTSGNTKETPVKLNMKHLFSAVSIAVKNGKTTELVLNSVTIPTIANSGTATIDYSGNAVSVNIPEPEVSESTPFVNAAAIANVNVSASGLVDILSQTVAVPTPFVVWPQTIPEMSISVEYTMNGSVYETTATIPSVKWEAGKLYIYTLVIGEADDILLNFTVKEWQEGASENYEFE